MNYSDSERIATVLTALDYQPARTMETADLVIFNTCSVRQKAEDRVVGQIRTLEHVKQTNSQLKIGLTGCMARLSGACQNFPKNGLCQKIALLDFQFKIEDLPQLPHILSELGQTKNSALLENAPTTSYFRIPPCYSSQAQAFIPIMTGCNNFCAYCIVPYARGRETSREIDEILAEAKKFVAQGGLEITLLGQNVNSYAPKNYAYKNEALPPFVKLLKEINQIQGIRRIRFTSPHPKDMSDALIESFVTLEHLCNHLHLPVQAGDDEILQKMNRHYTVADYQNLIEKIRAHKPDIAISTDIIVGFPGETEKQFLNTVQLFETVGFDLAYIAPYSPRPGTLAADKMEDDVPAKEKTRRFHYLNNILKKTSYARNQTYLGKTVEILVEKQENSLAEGETTSSKIVQFEASKNENLIGKIVPVKITEANVWALRGER